MFYYRVSDLAVTSDFELPGLIARAPSLDEPPDVVVRTDVAVDPDIHDALHGGPNWHLAADRFVLAIPGIARLLLIGGQEILVAPAEGVSLEDAAAFVCGTGFGILLHQRRQMVLHASAVRVGESAILFCGASGAGKSTIAAALGARGYDLAADDFCAISLRDGRPWLAPDGRLHKLWQHAISAMAMDERRAAAVRPAVAKYFVAPATAVSESLPIAAIYQLTEARGRQRSGIGQPNIVDAALIVRRHAYRPPLVQRMGQQDLYFQGAAAMAQQAGVYTLARRLRFADMPAVLDSLESHWRGLGMLDLAA